MLVGVPTEIKAQEHRVSLVPAGVYALCARGQKVLISKGAGLGSGIEDDEFRKAGAEIAESNEAVYAQADMIIKVKEPLPEEYGLIRPGQIVFTYFHFAASRELTDGMIATGASCIAYETITDAQGRLPLLTPMSEVAGRMSIQEGAKYLEKPQMGRGILLGGVPGVQPANVVILGGGIVGANAARIAAGLGAQVSILDISLDRLRHLSEVMPANVTTLFSNAYTIHEQVQRADLVIGAVLTAGARAPVLVPASYLKDMKNGAVIVDVAVDQGGCVETAHPTTHDDPTYVIDGVVHYCVANMPGAVGRTSTYALTNATQPYAIKLATQGLDAIKTDAGLAEGLSVHAGKLCHEPVAREFGMDFSPVSELLG